MHAEASNIMDGKPSHPKKHVKKIRHKTIGGSAQPNIGSKTKIFWGTAPNPIKWGYGYASKPP